MKLKIRGYDKTNGRWLESHELNVNTGKNGELFFSDNSAPFNKYGDVVLVVWTGLKDKNGVEIYEGDVLATPYVTPMGQLTEDEEEDSRQSVVFKHGGFVLDYGHHFVRLDTFAKRSKGEYVSNFGETFNIEDNTYFEVIGNIYENPELLK